MTPTPVTFLICAIDLGTSSTIAKYTRAYDNYCKDTGKLERQKLGAVCDVSDWPCDFGSPGSMDKICLPTELIYERATRKLLFWGFVAQRYLNASIPDPPLKDVFVVENIKLLLPESDEFDVLSDQTPPPNRFRDSRMTLMATLGKDPYEVFEDFLTCVLEYILRSAMKRYMTSLNEHHIELVLAFPSGWGGHIHTTVAQLGATAMENAFATLKLINMTFGIEDVYTVSEVLCGVKEWLREISDETSMTTSNETQIAAPLSAAYHSPQLQPRSMDGLMVSS
jgi:hypothetical protein